MARGAITLRNVDAPLTRRLEPKTPIDLGLTLGPLRHAGTDPTIRFAPDGVWRATRTPEGLATIHLRSMPGAIMAEAWGPGAAWALGAAGELVGLHDDPGLLVPCHPIVRELARRFAGLRIGRTRAVLESLVPAIIEQKVTGTEARRAYVGLLRRYGDPAPGPWEPARSPLRVPPSPKTLAGLPSYTLHELGLERRRAETLRRVGRVANRLEEAAGMAPDAALARLMAVLGIGPWTAAEVALRAFGDPDAVSVGDFHLPSTVSWALVHETRADDARMLELLEPYRGQRGRVIRLIEAAGIRPPAYGPRLSPRSISGI